MPDLIRMKPRTGLGKRTLGGNIIPAGGLSTRILSLSGFGPGPDFSAGVVAIPGYTDMDGSLLPTVGTPNAQGLSTSFGRIDNLHVENDPTNPSGSGKTFVIDYPGYAEDVDWPTTWCPNDFGGRSAAVWQAFPFLATTLGLDWQEINFRRRFKVSANWTQTLRLCSETTIEDFVCSASTITSLTRQTGTWTPGQFNYLTNGGTRYYLRRATSPQKGYLIVDNSATQLFIDPAHPGAYTGWGVDMGTVRIFRAFPSGALQHGAGTKLGFLRAVVDLGPVSGTVHGQAYSLPARTNVSRDNTFMSLVEGADNPDLYSACYGLQIDDWDGVTTDGQGAIGTNGQINFGMVSRRTFYGNRKIVGIPFDEWQDWQFIIRLNTPGLANGYIKIKRPNDVSPLYETSDADLVPHYVPATVVVGGVTYTVPQPVVAARWNEFSEGATLGGGLGIPEVTQRLSVSNMCVRGKNIPVTLPGAVADPTKLPNSKVGSTGRAPVAGVWPGRNVPAGTKWTEQTSGIPMMRLTDTSFPTGGSHSCDYPGSGPHWSQAWVGPDGHTYYTLKIDGGRLIHVRYDTFTATDGGQLPAGGAETNSCWSAKPGEERIIYVSTGSSIRRFNTATMQYQDTGHFPWSPGSDLRWLSGQRGDWLVCMNNTSHTVYALNTATGQSISCAQNTSGTKDGVPWSVPSIDEPHLDLTDPYVYLSVNAAETKQNAPWRLDTDTKPPASYNSNCTDGAPSSDDHVAPIRGGMIGAAGDGGTPYSGGYYWLRANGQPVRHRPGWVNYTHNNEFYHSAYNNLYGHQSSPTDQWYICEQWTNDGTDFSIRRGVIAICKTGDTTAAGIRYVCQHDTSPSAGYGQGQPRCQLSQDGKLGAFTSNMNGSGQYQIFVFRMPTT